MSEDLNIFLLDLITVAVLNAMVFFLQIFPPFSSEGLLLYIDPFIDDLAPQFVDRAVHHLSVCPIRHLPKPLVSCSGQYITIQGSSPHKCS